MLEKIILYGFVLVTAVQLFYWLFIFGRLAFYEEEKPTCEKGPGAADEKVAEGVSVIICARNEAENLHRHLDRILNQTYRSFEVILVDHKSSDNTLDVLSPLQRKFKQLRIVHCYNEKAGKKVALATGIGQAKYQVLLLTDADCVPASPRWIEGMVAGMSKNTQIVLGVAPYDEAPGPLNMFVRFEACYTAIQYLSFALAGIPYMGVGRNLAYRRELFDRIGGFRRHEHLASGDDDLFVNEAARKGNVGIRLNPETFVFSQPKLSWRAYYRQKTRHFTAGSHYKSKHIFLLTTLTMSHLLHYVLGGTLIAFKISIIFALLGYAARMGVVMVIGSRILTKLEHRSLRLWLPALDFGLVIYFLVFAPAVLMNKDTQRWN